MFTLASSVFRFTPGETGPPAPVQLMRCLQAAKTISMPLGSLAGLKPSMGQKRI